MSFEEGDQERWDELPEIDESADETPQTGNISRVAVQAETYAFAASTGTIHVQHAPEKVPQSISIWKLMLI